MVLALLRHDLQVLAQGINLPDGLDRRRRLCDPLDQFDRALTQLRPELLAARRGQGLLPGLLETFDGSLQLVGRPQPIDRPPHHADLPWRACGGNGRHRPVL